MSKVWLLIGILAGLLVGLVMPAEWRAKLSQPLVDVIKQMEERMPDE